MIMDFMRSCYKTRMRFFRLDPSRLSDVTWVWAKDSALPLPFPHSFSSRNWDSRIMGSNVLGEDVASSRRWSNGQNTSSRPGTSTGTNAYLWLNGDGLPADEHDEDELCEHRTSYLGLSGEGRFGSFSVITPTALGLGGYGYIFPHEFAATTHLGLLGQGRVFRNAINGSGRMLGLRGGGRVTRNIIRGDGGPLGLGGHGHFGRVLRGSGVSHLGLLGSGRVFRFHIGLPGAYLGCSGEGVIGPSYSLDVGGDLLLSGLATQEITGTMASSGGLLLSGLATQEITGTMASSGGLAMSGLATQEITGTMASSGGLTLGGVASEQITGTMASSGGLTLAGLATVVPPATAYSAAGAGALTLTGLASTMQQTTGCTTCNPAPYKWTFTVSGITNNLCTLCNAYNGTFTLTYTSGCIWQSSTGGCGAGGSVLWQLDTSGGVNFRLFTQGAVPAGRGSGNFWTKSIATWSCLGSNTLSLTTTGTSCATLPSTITITPA